MKHILSKQSHRFLTTLEHLYYNEYSSYENLALLSNVSSKTIVEDINKMNDFISPMFIAESSQNRCYLIQPDNISEDYIYSCILKNSLEFSVLEEIFFEKHNRLEDYADALFISVSTLKRIISRINERIEHNHFHIATNPIQLVGDEMLICNTMTHYFGEKYLGGNYPFNKHQYKIFEQLISFALSDYKDFLNYPDIIKIKLHAFVSIIRIQNGHFHKINHNQIFKRDYDFSFLDNYLLKMTFKSVFKIELNKKNIIDLTYPFLSEDFAFTYEDVLIICDKNEGKKIELVNISNLLTNISNSLNIPLSNDSKNHLILDLFNVRMLMIGDNFLINNKKNHFIKNLMNDYPVVYNYLIEEIFNNPNFYNYSQNEKEELSYIIITHWEGLLFHIQDETPLYKVGLCMTSDTEHTNLLTNILNRKFYKRFDFEPIIFNSMEEAYSQFKNYEVILTNFSNPIEDNNFIISIDPYPSMKDYVKIDKAYFRLINQNKKFN